MISLKSIVDKLYNLEDLSYQESYQLFDYFIKGQIELPLQTSILTALKLKKETSIEIAAAVEALFDNTKEFPKIKGDLAGIVGTGGDGFNTINISTTAAIVAATAGYKVAKHGGRSVSSKSGSFDLLESFGVNIELAPDQTKQCLELYNLGFLFAPFYSDGFRHIKEARTILKTRTIFNILGPLINPARPNKVVIGVYSKDLILPMAKTLVNLGIDRAVVVYGSGLDEVAIHDDTYVAEIQNNQIIEYKVSPVDFGIYTYAIKDLEGSLPEQNREIIKQILLGKGKEAHNAAVAVNVAMLMRLYDKDDLKQNTQEVLEIIKSGKCFNTLQQVINYSNK
ncbi:anthranilate phosphoribosyltransferase [Francisella tularensis subsp. holarctica PHIT-FT049]|uniref:anthranilate phosphoribosyltransferase n=1 Tax=Francisella tularensis TaxID=263 RepID=UPI00015D7AA8|nr:anthranilate phosphoribosyltransferase [Francisella tularensis]AHH47148.1 anthranilate phosphoribosyltransferase [Francisella tularensis subsp. holarctica PHIT-FT049]ALK94852.1 anthranilate phosphoribosyltransferase [Francisella tularensis]EDO65522.1 anthranilate phosphoribosyltransferase [Francisella tularensis subsp. holarctica FSC022]KIP31545.1 anthranilate phosphoribosyltransferase [Francisella tularensis subsp. holarctica]MCC9172553.1 anthranilate phosphoribosyltransferase [Francisella